MNTLHDRVVSSAPAEATHPPMPLGRTTLIDRTAMRLGMWLLLWGRHRSQRRGAADDVYARMRLAADTRAEHDRALAHFVFDRPIR
ncbi:hypothetical protein [Microbacterium sp. cx-59]|uniref:hypothetical protein n=1 Tax=Microbacterium sp. cx-59 TaxID=2891207 RepID=UPI001E496D54|nr:hypothetical protein [Microbacterium sp. cx-59]MCC4907106.1 hypothetical protein [Microbacterium sp. cx-59]